MSQVAFLFPGQGAQHVGMGVKIAEAYPAAKALFDQASEILGYNLLGLCANGPEEKLNATNISQPALYVSSLASLELVKDRQPELLEQCQIAAGLSLGEYTALAFAGALSFEDGLRVVKARGEAMQAAAEATPSGMVSILLLDEEKITGLCEQVSDAGLLQIANYLCPGNIVVSGDKAACEKVVPLAEENGGRPIPLKVAGAFHTPIMQSATEKLAAALESVEIQPSRLPVVSNVDAQPHHDAAEIRDILVKQVVHPVLWEKSMRTLLDSGVDHFCEIGPGAVLKGLMKRISRKTPFDNFNDDAV
ncbi:ACP S-malonyltransferase [Rubinisphaera brasiliensis]|uniref:Malonyl CoA-acyl carrier protein transacylase n=1 Tax=Rubinisphaera brasiliensis (strain ATCC 49424 / DSM 5305 / JCM 21570 / IAM 15109 / NBRC 103401 / IFAM 1448) TaxID=756272 RepID=F0SPV9_RUBBR|nr:ACP S-malonyltransferase [Rubinisphaera brasiliensis]ADY60109.1 (Acyl-carrier-protein) S-malonyltransferase [Rubinisphaera brasiliensis DSM 5305]